jgi:hypothetical protein
MQFDSELNLRICSALPFLGRRAAVPLGPLIPRLKVRVLHGPLGTKFLDFSGDACEAGVLVTATITSRSAWRTAVGLRVGDSVARLRWLYPRARLHGAAGPSRGYWLVSRRTCAEVGSLPFPGLLARIRVGRVAALVAGTTACE